MKKIKKIGFFTFSILLLMLLCSCGLINRNDNNKRVIVTTQYPQYDFVKKIVGSDKRLNDYYDVSLIVPPGADSHTFDPRLTDLIKIKNADLFIYTSDTLETWVQKLEINNYTKVLDLSSDERIELINVEEHDHEDEHHHHAHDYDPHYWIYPVYAEYMIDEIRNKMLEISPDLAKECKDLINNNADEYISKLDIIDTAIKEVVNLSKNKTLYFASPFSFYYWAHYYDLEYVLTYATCSTEVEPPMTTIIDVINSIKENEVKVIYIKELLNDDVAQLIAKETGAKINLLHSCHNVSKIDFENNKSYYDIMVENVYSLAEGLGVESHIVSELLNKEENDNATNGI
ncbi:MAG: metal ABC transporter substrate-binding protein [Bacilli bacterium]|nr:metal ABC transporter substrate-binding protein [Bacilli bacterium]MDD7314865.1 metal ABC transporter substrate-binding protein [Bacilli bacterium]MDY4053227.1 metal ABC transporter substrate-binding protein [Bacilli bacterium]